MENSTVPTNAVFLSDEWIAEQLAELAADDFARLDLEPPSAADFECVLRWIAE